MMNLDQYQAMIFDFDGVILDSEPWHFEACRDFFDSIQAPLTYQDYLARYLGLSDHEMFPKVLHDHNIELSSNDIRTLISKKVANYTEIVQSSHALPTVPGVIEFIDSARCANIKIAICSGSTRPEIETVLSKIHHGELHRSFETIVTANDLQFGKPSPEGYLLTANRLQVSPTQCLVFEDAPPGIKAAKSANMDVMAVLTTHQQHELMQADWITTDFTWMTMKEKNK